MLLGGPIDFWTPERGRDRTRRLSPVFLQPVLVQAEADHLRLDPTDAVQANHGWFEERFRRERSEGEDFLIRSGLMEPGVEDEQLSAAPGVSLDQLWSAVASRMPGLWADPTASPDSLAELNLQSGRPGFRSGIVLIRPRRSPFTQGLLAELREIVKAPSEELERTALRWVFKSGRNFGDETLAGRDSMQAELSTLNEEQRETCSMAQDAPLLVVKGPPGTGKSTVVQHVVINMLLQGRSTLFASRNHRALDAVVPKLNQIVESTGHALMLRLTPPKGEAQTATLNWLKMITELLTQPVHRDDALSSAAQARLRASVAAREHAELAVLSLLEGRDELARIEQHLRDPNLQSDLSEEQLRDLPDLGAPDVPDALTAELRRGWPHGLAWLARIPARVRTIKFLRSMPKCSRGAGVAGWSTPVEALTQELEMWSGRVQHQLTLKCREEVLRRLASQSPRDELEQCLERCGKAVTAATSAALEVAAREMGARPEPHEVEAFANLRGALHGQKDTLDPRKLGQRLTKLIRSQFGALLRAFPAWACSNLSMRSRLPLSPGVFDLVIIDEASQCDIASVIPLLYRAKRAMVVGDPMQLRHLATVSNQIDLRIRQTQGLDDDARFGRFRYGPNSIYDLAATSARVRSSTAVRELVEHYRCHPAIARYFGDTFYAGTLTVRTAFDRARLEKLRYRGAVGLVWMDVGGASVTEATSRYCPEQIEAVVRELKRLAEDRFQGTVGVVTPFRAQANRIRDAAHQTLPADQLREWQFVSETADGFQGDERDVVLFSLIGGGDGRDPTPPFYRKDVNRFNVAVSRARLVLHVFGDRNWVRNCGIDHLQRLLQAHETELAEADETVRWDLVGPVWEPAFAEALRVAGLPFRQQYRACGYFLDFALFPEGRKVNVEVDGETYHREASGDRRLADVYRDQALKAAGWIVLRFWVYELREDMEGCVERVRRIYCSS